MAALLGGIGIPAANATNNLTLCVFDPLGVRGDAFSYAKDYATKMLQLGVKSPVIPKVYTNEAIAAEDFKTGQCDAVILTTLRAREFNQYAGSLDSIGAIPNRQDLSIALPALASKQLAPKMSVGDYEVDGIVPLGTAYIMVNDRSINTLVKAAGKKIAVLDYDQSQAKLVQRVGAQPVSVDLTTISGKFNNHQVDAMAAPALLFKPLELSKGMTDRSGAVKGAVIRFPLIQITAMMVVHKRKFPDEDVNQKIREFANSQIGTAYKIIDNAEKEIDAKYWLDVALNDKVGYVKLMHDARIDLTKNGIYNTDMMHLLKKIRCKTDPASFECALNDE